MSPQWKAPKAGKSATSNPVFRQITRKGQKQLSTLHFPHLNLLKNECKKIRFLGFSSPLTISMFHTFEDVTCWFIYFNYLWLAELQKISSHHNFQQERMKEERESPIHGPLPMKLIWNLFLVLSYCVIILRKTPHWSVRMTSYNSRLLTWKQQIKITFVGLVQTNNKFKIIIMGHGNSLSYFILSCFQMKNDPRSDVRK